MELKTEWRNGNKKNKSKDGQTGGGRETQGWTGGKNEARLEGQTEGTAGNREGREIKRK